jgi:type II secretory pathway component PulM
MLTVKIHEQQKEWAIKATTGVVALVLCYSVIIHPVFHEIVVSRQRLVDSRTSLDLYREIGEFKKDLAGGESSLMTLTERSVVLGKIADMANQLGIDVNTLTPRTEPEGGYVRLKIEMEGRGSFFSLIKFLKAVETLNVAIKVRDVSLLRKSSEGPSEKKYFLQIHLVFETLLKPRAPKNNG